MIAQTLSDRKRDALRKIESYLHDVAFMLNHRCFNDDPGYYTKNAAWKKLDALEAIEDAASLRIAKKTINASIDAIVGLDRWNALTDPRSPEPEPPAPAAMDTGELWQDANGNRIAHIEHDNGTWTAVDCRNEGTIIGTANWTENIKLFRSMGYEHIGFLNDPQPEPPAPAVTHSPEKIARASLKLSPFLAGHDSTGNRYQRFRSESDYGASYGPDIVQSHYAGLWNVEVYGRDEDGFWGYTRVAHHVTKKEATAVARDLAIAEYITQHTCPDCQTFVPGPDGCTCVTVDPQPEPPAPAADDTDNEPACTCGSVPNGCHHGLAGGWCGQCYTERHASCPRHASDDTDHDPEPYEPGVFGGAHPGDDETDNEDAREAEIIAAAQTMMSESMRTWEQLIAPDHVTTDLNNINALRGNPLFPDVDDYLRQRADEMLECTPINGEIIPETIVALFARVHVHRAIRAWFAAHPTSPAPTNNVAAELATIPAIGGGSHEADTQPTKPRNVATSQKRDNQRAQRAALNEAYKAHAAGKASEVSDILIAFGFTVISTKDVDGTPVTIWQDTNPQEIDGTNPAHIAHATIKQTPYSLRIYNGQPARLPRHGDAELINRVEHGWCACGDARGYAAGLADAILRLIETPDPYGLALDAIEAREADQSAPDTQAEYGMLYQRISDAADTIGLDADEAEAAYDEYLAAVLPDSSDLVRAAIRSDYTIAAPGHDGRPVIIADVEHHDVSDNLGALVIRNGRAELVYPERPTIAEAAPDVSDHLPELVLHGGQPSMSGPWELPVMSGGSQDVTMCERCDTYPAMADGLCQHCQPTICADCGITSDDCDIERIMFGDLAPRCPSCMAVYRAYVDRLNTPACQHDADEPPARFCSQCGHDASPDAPQPTDTGTSHDVTTPSDPDTGDRVTIEHTPEGGTIATGDTRPQSATLKMCGWKWSRQLGAWYVPNSRDRRPDMYKINKTAQALRGNHASVTLEIDDRAVDPATVEANRAERLADRHAALHRKAEKLDAEAFARFSAADTLADMIPFGQPILVGHHSEHRHRNHVAKIERNMDKGVEAFRASEDAAHRATAGERRQAQRLTAPATMRRIEKLETERRDLERRAARGQVDTIGGPTIAERLDDNARDLAYWREHLATLEAEGVKVWGPSDFQTGDWVKSWAGTARVVRVNKKSVTVQDPQFSFTQTVTWDEIRAKVEQPA